MASSFWISETVRMCHLEPPLQISAESEKQDKVWNKVLRNPVFCILKFYFENTVQNSLISRDLIYKQSTNTAKLRTLLGYCSTLGMHKPELWFQLIFRILPPSHLKNPLKLYSVLLCSVLFYSSFVHHYTMSVAVAKLITQYLFPQHESARIDGKIIQAKN